MVFLSIYRCLYYRLFKWARYVGETEIPEFNAFCLLTMIESLNVLTVIVIFEKLVDQRIITLITPSRVFGLTVLALLALANYWIFLRGKKYKVWISKYDDESTWNRRLGNILCGAYVIGSVLSFLVLILSTASFNK